MSTDALAVAGWGRHFETLCERISSCFGWRDLRRRAQAYLRGLLGPVKRKNGWQLVKHLGDATPDAVQRLLEPVCWDADAGCNYVKARKVP